MTLRPWPDLEVRDTQARGRGVFSSRDFRAGETVEVAPLIHLSKADHERVMKTDLIRYVFDMGRGTAGVALGYVSLYNHSDEANAEFDVDAKKSIIRITAVAPIAAGHEITIDYGYHPAKPETWDPEYAEFENSKKR